MKYIFYGCASEAVIQYICEYIDPSTKSMPTQTALLHCGAIAFSDRAEELWSTEYLGIPVIAPDEIASREYDKIIISGFSVDSILSDLIHKYGIEKDRIIDSPGRLPQFMREKFLRTMAQLLKKRCVRGSCAEGGVYRGDFASIINECFPDNKLYLFDSFEGFAQNDVQQDEAMIQSGHNRTYFAETTIDVVLSKMPHPEKIIVKKGWFPHSADGVDDIFAFVSLDFDLYSPIKAGLEWFYPRLEPGGIILIHDYFHSGYDCRMAVDEFCLNSNIHPFPIGDILSVGIIKN